MPLLSRELIRSYLDRRGYTYERDSDGDFAVPFSLENEPDRKLFAVVMLSGPDQDILTMRGISHFAVPETQLGSTLVTCNAWNLEYRWPKAYLDADQDPAKIHLEYGISLVGQVDQESIDQILANGFNGIIQFWSWAADRGVTG